ncbi:MAG: hydroxymethylbilane synthase [Crocinitomicaceae bacterium]|nr:hydroxymethylbilane synthase [Crocinitomicaceae bacterium]
MKHIVIGSRGSDLALWQANFVQSELEKLGCSVEIKIIKTQGDRIQHLSFDKLEGKGFFTKEIEDALLNGSIDLAVHSHKDLETTPPKSLTIACVSERANPADLLLIRKDSLDTSQKWNLKVEANVGTSSARRKSQLLNYRADATVTDLRGNVPTRIDKLRQGHYDAILLAKAGVDRLELDLSEFHAEVLDPTEFIPAPAQGVLGLQIRETDHELAGIMQKMNSPKTAQRIELERKVLNLLDGGCQLPLGVYCDENDHLYVSFAKGVNEKCIHLDYSVTNFEGMAEKVISDLHK